MRLEGGFGMLDVSDPALHDGLVSPKERFGGNRSGDKDNDVDFSESQGATPHSPIGFRLVYVQIVKYTSYGLCTI